MNFKNDFEQQCFDIAQRVLGGGVEVEHNKTIKIESALFPEVAAFKGPPSKEVDVLVAQLLDAPKIVLLISCKFLGRKAEPAHVQEWGAVVQAMNKYSNGTLYLGLIISVTGFTSGCEAWATSHNIGIVPPLKGRRLGFGRDTVLRMYERVLAALRARVRLKHADLHKPPEFFNFVYRLVTDFEGHEEAAQGGRYFVMPQKWASSFGEMYTLVRGRVIEDLVVTDDSTVLKLSGGVVVEVDALRVEFGKGHVPSAGMNPTPICRKNLSMTPCTLDFIKTVVVGKPITSAGDFNAYVEFGVDQKFNLGLHPNEVHLLSTENPIADHEL